MRLILALLCALFAAPAYASDWGDNPWTVITRALSGSAQAAPRHADHFRDTTKMIAHGGAMRASWYGGSERLNRHAADGSVFRPGGFTVAHRSLPFGTRLQISYAGRSVVARVTDRGPAAWTGRSLDVSRGVAQALGFKARGTAVLHVARLN